MGRQGKSNRCDICNAYKPMEEYISGRIEWCVLSLDFVLSPSTSTQMKDLAAPHSLMAVREVQQPQHLKKRKTYLRRMPKNIFNLLPSSGGFSAAADVAFIEEASEAVEGAVEVGELRKEPEDAEAMKASSRKRTKQTMQSRRGFRDSS